MVQKTNKNIGIAKKFKQNASKLIKIEKIILFGSRAKGNFSEESDFDLMVVSNNFAKKPFYKRPIELYSKWKLDYPLELICYTEEELKQKLKNPYSTASQAIKTGISI
ncbi:MAG TPA: nucleotidyltransferase domain-containing protein [archaeon]|nr:nucleotidyltransferase domain-containing protein [archaeon]